MEFFCGTNQATIPVPPGTQMGGYAARNEPSKGEHDPLHVKTIALRAGTCQADTIIIVACDLVGLEQGEVRAVKEDIHARAGVPAGNILIAATHTHSGPRTIALFGEPCDGYKRVYELIQASIMDALGKMEPASLHVAKCKIENVTFNRRVYDPSSAPVDDECTVLVARGCDGEARAIAYNFACHPVVMGADNLLVSSDWVFYANEAVKRAFPRAMPVFLQGSSGNLNPVNTPIIGDVPKHTFDDAASIGTPVGEAVAQAATGASPVSIALPAGTIKEVSIVADDEDKEEIFTFAAGVKTGEGYRVKTLVQALSVGNVSIAGVPGELFSEISLAIKASQPGRHVMVVGYANDYIGYIPTLANYMAGGYEVAMMSLSEDEGSIIERAAIDALQEVMKER